MVNERKRERKRETVSPLPLLERTTFCLVREHGCFGPLKQGALATLLDLQIEPTFPLSSPWTSSLERNGRNVGRVAEGKLANRTPQRAIRVIRIGANPM